MSQEAVRDRKLTQIFKDFLPEVEDDNIEVLVASYSSSMEEQLEEGANFDPDELAMCMVDLCIGADDPDEISRDICHELNSTFSFAKDGGETAFAVGDSIWAKLMEDEEYHEAIVEAVEGEIVKVFFVDFGVVRELPKCEVVPFNDEDGDHEGSQGLCEMCKRDAKLTIHHMIPRSEHARYIARGYAVESLKGPANFAMICRPCHNMVHRSESNKVLADTMYTVELICAHPKIAKWIKYASTKSHLTGR